MKVYYYVVRVVPMGGKYWVDPADVTQVYREKGTRRFITYRNGKKVYVPRKNGTRFRN